MKCEIDVGLCNLYGDRHSALAASNRYGIVSGTLHISRLNSTMKLAHDLHSRGSCGLHYNGLNRHTLALILDVHSIAL